MHKHYYNICIKIHNFSQYKKKKLNFKLSLHFLTLFLHLINTEMLAEALNHGLYI